MEHALRMALRLQDAEAGAMNRPEQDMHKAVVSHLKLRSVPRVFFWHTPNEGRRGWVNAAALKAMGMVSGVPDLVILKGGELFALELKATSGRLTPSQRLVMERMRDCGAHVAVAKSLDEALVTLECWGIIKRDCSVASESVEASHDATGQDEKEIVV
jgi:hypothetical protein